jgi:hypothetical protein
MRVLWTLELRGIRPLWTELGKVSWCQEHKLDSFLLADILCDESEKSQTSNAIIATIQGRRVKLKREFQNQGGPGGVSTFIAIFLEIQWCMVVGIIQKLWEAPTMAWPCMMATFFLKETSIKHKYLILDKQRLLRNIHSEVLEGTDYCIQCVV